ncbi:MAG: hypothetical protein ACLR8P_08810 [Clostridium fessum]
MTSRSTFDKRIHSLKPASEYEDDGTVEYGVRVIKDYRCKKGGGSHADADGI